MALLHWSRCIFALGVSRFGIVLQATSYTIFWEAMFFFLASTLFRSRSIHIYLPHVLLPFWFWCFFSFCTLCALTRLGYEKNQNDFSHIWHQNLAPFLMPPPTPPSSTRISIAAHPADQTAVPCCHPPYVVMGEPAARAFARCPYVGYYLIKK